MVKRCSPGTVCNNCYIPLPFVERYVTICYKAYHEWRRYVTKKILCYIASPFAERYVTISYIPSRCYIPCLIKALILNTIPCKFYDISLDLPNSQFESRLNFCFDKEWNVIKLFVNSCDIINKIHVSFDEKISPKHAEPAFSLTRRVGTIPVYGCFWSKFEVNDKYELIVKLMSDINQQVRHHITCVCLYFLRFFGNVHNYGFKVATPSIRFLPCWKRL
jgi:hypothetical protein